MPGRSAPRATRVRSGSGVLPARNEHLERLAPWLEHLLHDKPAHHARLIRPFAYWFVLRRARGFLLTRGHLVRYEHPLTLTGLPAFRAPSAWKHKASA